MDRMPTRRVFLQIVGVVAASLVLPASAFKAATSATLPAWSLPIDENGVLHVYAPVNGGITAASVSLGTAVVGDIREIVLHDTLTSFTKNWPGLSIGKTDDFDLTIHLLPENMNG